MDLDRYPALAPDEGEVLDTELAVTGDLLAKVFALGPGARLPAHDHPGSTNVFHVVEGEVVVVQGENEQHVTAPGVVVHDRGTVHGARNESEERAVITATMAPPP